MVTTKHLSSGWLDMDLYDLARPKCAVWPGLSSCVHTDDGATEQCQFTDTDIQSHGIMLFHHDDDHACVPIHFMESRNNDPMLDSFHGPILPMLPEQISARADLLRVPVHWHCKCILDTDTLLHAHIMVYSDPKYSGHEFQAICGLAPRHHHPLLVPHKLLCGHERPWHFCCTFSGISSIPAPVRLYITLTQSDSHRRFDYHMWLHWDHPFPQ